MMRNFYVTVLMAILLPLTNLANPISSKDALFGNLNKPIDISPFKFSANDIVDVKVGDFPAPQMALDVIIQNTDYFWNAMFEGVTPFTYEPKSGTLVYVTTKREFRQSDSVYVSHIVLYFSKDKGVTWTNEIVHSYEKGLFFFPSVAVLNPDNATDPIDFKYVLTSSLCLPENLPDGTIGYYNKGAYFVYLYGKLDGVSSWDNKEINLEEAPTDHNLGFGQKWALPNKRMLSVSSPKGDHFYVYGILEPQDGFQYGAYGLGYINFTQDAEPQSRIPTAWGLEKFYYPENLENTYNAPMRMDADEEGNVYAFFNNVYPDDETKRLPGYSKSTDNGRTWSEIQKMPFDKITDYLSIYNHNLSAFGYAIYPYTSWDAVVTGEDEFSMFLRYTIADGTEEENAKCQGHIVEISYKDGNWQPIKKVGDFLFTDGFQYHPPMVIQFFPENPPITYSDDLNYNYRYEELEASKTSDGAGIVVKWNTPPSLNHVGKLDKVQKLHGSTMTIDRLLCTDIFIATRTIEATSWESYNITDDLWYNKGTYLAKPAPSLNVIPVAEHITQQITDPINYRYSYPYFLQNVVGDRKWSDMNGETRILYTIVIATFDSENPKSISNPDIQRPEGLVGMSVHEQLPFAIQNISPNPANEVAQLTFNLDINADVKIDIRNSMGQTLKAVNVTNAQIGENTINVVTNDLPAGAYFYTITVNGKSQTKLLNVVR